MANKPTISDLAAQIQIDALNIRLLMGLGKLRDIETLRANIEKNSYEIIKRIAAGEALR